MKFTILLSLIILVACNTKEGKVATTDPDVSNTTAIKEDETRKDITPPLKSYSNERFKEVTVEKIGKDSFLIRGQGQIFEASFSWIVEDGHNELKKGFQMTDAGASDWGNFEFTIQVQKERENSTLTLVLFESSAKDGSRQYELPIPLTLIPILYTNRRYFRVWQKVVKE